MSASPETESTTDQDTTESLVGTPKTVNTTVISTSPETESTTDQDTTESAVGTPKTVNTTVISTSPETENATSTTEGSIRMFMSGNSTAVPTNTTTPMTADAQSKKPLILGITGGVGLTIVGLVVGIYCRIFKKPQDLRAAPFELKPLNQKSESAV